jgi:hypothetical protein
MGVAAAGSELQTVLAVLLPLPALDGIEPFACSLGRVTIHHKPSDTSLGRRPSRG